jgi:hypothetical protein
MARPPPLPRARSFLSLGPLVGLLTREAARTLPSPALADTPAPLARVFSLSGRPVPPVSRVVFPAYDAPPSLHRRPFTVVPSITVPSPHRKSSAPPRPPPLDQRPCPVPPHRGVSSAALCGINAGAVHLTGARRAPWSLIGGAVRH